MNIQFATSNASKVALAQDRLGKYGIRVIQLKLNLQEHQDLEVEKVAEHKAQQVMEKSDDPFVIEDSAFYIDSLNGFPGTFVKMAFRTLGEDRICKLVASEQNKRAYVKGALIFGNPITKELKQFVGIYEGEIAEVPRGMHTRGWDLVRIFIPKGWDKTLAELDDTEWTVFLEEFKQGDQYEQFGKWAQTNL